MAYIRTFYLFKKKIGSKKKEKLFVYNIFLSLTRPSCCIFNKISNVYIATIKPYFKLHNFVNFISFEGQMINLIIIFVVTNY